MNLRQRYKSRSVRRFTRFLGFYSILAFFLLFYSTFARYTTVVENESTVEIANWKIMINDYDILNGGTITNKIKLIPSTETTTDNKLAPGQEGYFDIVINPEGTDVAIEYTINFNVANLPEDITLKTYEILEDSVSADLENNNVSGEIDLQQMQQLSSSDTKTVRIYWEWNENSTAIPTGEESYKIEAVITIKQKIS